MRTLSILTMLIAVAASAAFSHAVAQPATDSCAPARIVEIRAGGPEWRRLLTVALQCPNTEVRLGPDVEMDFDGVKWSIEGDPPDAQFPLLFGRCVTLKSVAGFEAPASASPAPFTCPPEGGAGGGAVILGPPAPASVASTDSAGADASVDEPAFNPSDVTAGSLDDLTVEPAQEFGSARTPHSRGPVLRFGGNHARLEVPDDDSAETLIQIRCFPEYNHFNDGVRISGFRLEGPRDRKWAAARIIKCVDVEISNMEIDGWDEGVSIADDDVPEGEILESDAGRIKAFDDIRIYNNYFHHNENPSEGGHAGGYGVSLGDGAWAAISNNVFDDNRHAIAASGDAGGYSAIGNLVLKGGGVHDGSFAFIGIGKYTHQFDVHGTHTCIARKLGLITLAVVVVVSAVVFVATGGLGAAIAALIVLAAAGAVYGKVTLDGSLKNCGYAGFDTRIISNAFQYQRSDAVHIRGMPRIGVSFSQNVFPQDELWRVSELWGDPGIRLNAGANITIVDDNRIEIDTFGDYGVCDFDGDGIDDLFQATGASWWYSSYGEFQWSYMNSKKQLKNELYLGYFDNDRRCDVLTEAEGKWLFVSGGYGDWSVLGDQDDIRKFDTPLADVRFGRFDPHTTDVTPGAPTRRTTHALRRRSDDQWEVTALDRPDWRTTDARGGPYANSGFSLDELQFGDFTGDGVTDVLALTGGQWQISKSAQSEWAPLNTLHDEMSRLIVANLDADDNIDDVLRLDAETTLGISTKCNWYRSKNGVEVWQPLFSRTFEMPTAELTFLPGCYGYAGRFGAKPGGGVVTIDLERFGRFFSEAEKTAENPTGEFASVFPY